jgi:hypothetical protein
MKEIEDFKLHASQSPLIPFEFRHPTRTWYRGDRRIYRNLCCGLTILLILVFAVMSLAMWIEAGKPLNDFFSTITEVIRFNSRKVKQRG